MAESNSPGYVESVGSSRKKTKEDLRIDQLIPSEILDSTGDTGIKLLLEKYYEFMNLNEFIYDESETHTDLVLDGVARFRISDPNNENNQFFTDEQGSSSTLKVTDADGNDTSITINSTNIAISNGNELPGSLKESTSEIGKTFTVSGLSAHNGKTATLVTPVKNWVGPGPSYVLNAIEDYMDIDKNSDSELDATHQYLEMMQKEIASAIPRGLLVNKNTLYKRIIDFYKIRGSSDSIETFFRLLFNEEVEIERPYDNTLIPSSGDWDQGTGQFVSTKGFVSEKKIRLHDSYRYQKYSYLIKTGKNLTDWEYTFNRLVHPAGFIFFGEILLLINMVRNARLAHQNYLLTGSGSSSKGVTVQTKNPETGNLVDQLVNVYGVPESILSSMPGIQPGVIGAEDLPLLVEMFAAIFNPSPRARVARTAILSPVISSGAITAVEIVNGGYGYASAPTLTVSGTGSNATLTAVLTSEGIIDSVTVNNGGSGYTEAAVSAPAPSIGTGKISDITMNLVGNNVYRKPPIINIGAPTAVDLDGNLLSSNVQATAEFIMEPASIATIRMTNGGSNYSTPPAVTISDPTSYYTATPFFTEDYENASVANEFGDGKWKVVNTTDHTASIQTVDSTKVLQVQTTTLDTDASGTIGGAVYKLRLFNPENTYSLRNNTVKVKCRAKKPSSGGADTFRMAYSTTQHGNSGWHVKNLTTDWKDFEFEYNINNNLPTNEDYVGFQSDGSNGIVYIDNVSITAKIDRAVARTTVDPDGRVDGIILEHGGSGFTEIPTITFTGGGGSNATSIGLLAPTEISSINITNRGNGYVLDPAVTLGSSMVTEKRAKETGMRLIQLLNYDINASRANENNNYFKLKGNSYYDSEKKFGLNTPIELFGSQTIQSNNINSINSYNISSFITEE